MHTQINPIIPFAFGNSLVRSLKINDKAWFIAKDVCDVLELTNSRMAVDSLDEDEVASVSISDTSSSSRNSITMQAISESGLYALIFKSRKPEAKAFRKWVTSEVIPSVLKTGSYSFPQKSRPEAILDFVTSLKDLNVDEKSLPKIILTAFPVPSKKELLKTQKEETPAEPTHVELEIQEILSLLKPGITYRLEEIAALLPKGHRLSSGTISATRSALGKLLQKACRLRLLEKIPGRTTTFQLSAMIPA